MLDATPPHWAPSAHKYIIQSTKKDAGGEQAGGGLGGVLQNTICLFILVNSILVFLELRRTQQRQNASKNEKRTTKMMMVLRAENALRMVLCAKDIQVVFFFGCALCEGRERQNFSQGNENHLVDLYGC